MLLPWQDAVVTSIVEETPEIRRFYIQVQNCNSFVFEAGQFVTLDLPIHEQKNKRWRSYSIASAPTNSNVIELLIERFEKGAGTNYLFNQLQIGSQLKLRGPQGKFVLPNSLNENLYLICTGVGIAPLISMLKHIAHSQLSYKHITLIFGCQCNNYNLYEKDVEQLKKLLPNFEVYACCVDEVEVVKLMLTQTTQKHTDTSLFYICGWKDMVDDVRKHIASLGFDKSQIKFELFG